MMKKNKTHGFTLFIAMVITSTLLLVSMGIISVAVREAFLTSASRESQYAFYAADTGIECALFWDVKNSTGYSAFSTSTQTTIYCNNQSFTVGGSDVMSFNLPLSPYCAIVTVTKSSGGKTKIDSHGYNTCDPTSTRRVERAVQVNY